MGFAQVSRVRLLRENRFTCSANHGTFCCEVVQAKHTQTEMTGQSDAGLPEELVEMFSTILFQQRKRRLRSLVDP